MKREQIIMLLEMVLDYLKQGNKTSDIKPKASNSVEEYVARPVRAYQKNKEPKRACKIYTIEELAQLRELFSKKSMTPKKAAKIMGRTDKGVASRYKRLIKSGNV